ncbi:MAG: SUMF1/EgtB/PvdO family nonheme iron enzyme [Chitinophagaceae bacterium]|nr:SUMF1/EgtB/PvdO family nonheme iron enzyme [Chitinophagaceae bacterium]
MMKNIFLKLIVLGATLNLVSCASGPRGELIGNPNKLSANSATPVGMVWVPSGVMHMGASDQDVRSANDVKNRTIQMVGFYMDATEVTNSEYRQYVNWVKDSTAHSLLGNFKDEDESGNQLIDWRKKIKWTSEEVTDAMFSYFIPASESIWGKKEFDNGKLMYHYEEFDYDQMAKNPNAPRSSYLRKYDIKAYPDTTVWMKMFTYSYNEPITHQYFWHPSFNNYPVVGVNWYQANAFAHWRTKFWRSYRDSKKVYQEGAFRLPSEEQWEWAARGGRTQSPYPWGGPYLVNKKGCYYANFKPNRGNYSADGGLYTVRADAYNPNDYGLYNMSGNVSEWTSSPYVSAAYNQVADMSPDIKLNTKDNDPIYWKRKSIRGGSWKDVAYYLQVSSRDYEFADTAKAYIGFRCITEFIAPALTNKRPKKN